MWVSTRSGCRFHISQKLGNGFFERTMRSGRKRKTSSNRNATDFTGFTGALKIRNDGHLRTVEEFLKDLLQRSCTINLHELDSVALIKSAISH